MPMNGEMKVNIDWYRKGIEKRGLIIGEGKHKNIIGAYSGPYALYRSLAIAHSEKNATAALPFEPPTPFQLVEHVNWFREDKIITFDPYGYLHASLPGHRPTIAITEAKLNIPEIDKAVSEGGLTQDGTIINNENQIKATKLAIDPVWYLPGIARRLQMSEQTLRQSLHESLGFGYPELIHNPEKSVFLPPIGGMTAYVFGNPKKLFDASTEVTCRVHDECNGSDVFGSDLCTCRPYLIYGIEHCIQTAQRGGVGIILYNRKEGRALGEVIKFLVYNARKYQQGGDKANTYFQLTECVAGVRDARFQELMPDFFHWLGITKIDHFISMSPMKFSALTESGIRIKNRVDIPSSYIPKSANIEMTAKIKSGYYTKSA